MNPKDHHPFSSIVNTLLISFIYIPTQTILKQISDII